MISQVHHILVKTPREWPKSANLVSQSYHLTLFEKKMVIIEQLIHIIKKIEQLIHNVRYSYNFV